MSHVVTIATEVRDPDAVAAACRRLGLPRPTHGTATLFEGQVSGLLVRLPGWLYPVVCDTASSTVRFDYYNQAWGRQEHLDSLLQAYAVEKARIEAIKRGHSVSEQPLSDGLIIVSSMVNETMVDGRADNFPDRSSTIVSLTMLDSVSW